MAVLRPRSTPRPPRLVAILPQANSLDANPSLQEFAPARLEFPSENTKFGHRLNSCSFLVAKTPSRHTAFVPASSGHETKRSVRAVSTQPAQSFEPQFFSISRPW